MVAPWLTQAITPSTQPKQWNSGTGMHTRSAAGEVLVGADPVAVVEDVVVGELTPLGNPVVPEVYCMFTTSMQCSWAWRAR